MILKISCFAVFVVTAAAVCHAGPYAPAAGQADSTAISKTDAALVGWATGYEDYVIGANVDLTWQTPDKALGPAVGDSFDIVGLGNAGKITLTFANAIANGTGFDFAVFENSFADTFLELAYIEVSSNGTDFFRFANDSLTAAPVGAFGATDPTNLDGLAGKYRQGFGTPFDLAQLVGVSQLLDVTNVGFVRIVDIVGDGTYLDTSGDTIYDPHPTSGTGGFDLDAVGVLHAVPEPGTLAMVLTGILSALTTTRLRKTPKEKLTMRGQPSTFWAIAVLAIVALGARGGSASAAIVDFDDPSLAIKANSHWNGPDPDGTLLPDPFDFEEPIDMTLVVGDFESRGVKFVNKYNTNYGNWEGFAYSNHTDTTTPGFGNQFSAFAGTGHGAGSDNYGVAFGYVNNLNPSVPSQLAALPQLELPNGAIVQSAYVTNTTYAGLTMRDGDAFSKKFGGETGEDQDWFKLTVYGTDASDDLLGDVVNFLLADYQFANPQDDYILNDWTLVDLSSLAGARRLYFNLTSSDTGTFGMNTPGFFAIDDIQFVAVPEPAGWILLAAGAMLLGFRRLRWRRRVDTARGAGIQSSE